MIQKHHWIRCLGAFGFTMVIIYMATMLHTLDPKFILDFPTNKTISNALKLPHLMNLDARENYIGTGESYQRPLIVGVNSTADAFDIPLSTNQHNPFNASPLVSMAGFNDSTSQNYAGLVETDHGHLPKIDQAISTAKGIKITFITNVSDQEKNALKMYTLESVSQLKQITPPILENKAHCDCSPNSRFVFLNNACVDFAGLQYYHNGAPCKACTLHRATYHPTKLDPRSLTRRSLPVVSLGGFGIVVDCWKAASNPMHLFMGLHQLQQLARYTFDRRENVSWVGFRGCGFHKSSSFHSFFRSELIPAVMEPWARNFSEIKLVSLEMKQRGFLCFRRALLYPVYGGLPTIVKAENRYPTCRQQINVGIFRRSEGSSLRRFCNHDELRNMVKSFTSGNVFTVSTSSKLSFTAQVEAYSSVDFVITPHGSHLFILYFVSRVRAVLEVAALYYDPLGFAIASNRKSDHFVSYGHKLARADCSPHHALQRELQKRCAAQFRDEHRFVNKSARGTKCGFPPAIHQSITVDLPKATRDIGLALHGFPDCPQPQAAASAV